MKGDLWRIESTYMASTMGRKGENWIGHWSPFSKLEDAVVQLRLCIDEANYLMAHDERYVHLRYRLRNIQTEEIIPAELFT